VDASKVPPLSAVGQIAGLLDSPEIATLVSELEATRWTGRPGYPIRGMIGMALAKSIYAVPTWTRTVALVREHGALRAAICGSTRDVPSVYACYRFTAKLRQYADILTGCIDRVTASLQAQLPDYGRNVAVDGSDMPAYANGQRFVSKHGPERERYSDPNASWGHRSAVSTRKGGGFYGYKVHAAVCAVTGLPLAWTVETAGAAETNFALPLLDATMARGFDVNVAIADKGYDNNRSTTAAWTATLFRSRRCARRPPSRAATTTRRHASTARGRSPEPTSSAARPSGAARPASASRSRVGSRPTDCTCSSRATATGPASSTAAVAPWSASSDGSRTSGRYCRCGSVDWIGCVCTRT
jgi:hypothetical protein